jgi:tetratricopeptide (TPR) repeat protein
MQACKHTLAAALILLCVIAAGGPIAAQDTSLDTAKLAYEKGDYGRAIELLNAAAAKEPRNGDVFLWLTKSQLEAKQYDAAVASGEKAVAINPKSSVYHQLLGEAYGEKADHSGILSAYSWARKAQKEFETAVQLDERNFDAAQDLIEYDCTAPGIAGGGEDKAQAVIQKLMRLDAAEGHYGAGLCRKVKKDFASADSEYAKALESKPKTSDRVYGIGDYFEERGQGDKLLTVANDGESLGPQDPRGKYYRAVGWILRGEKYPEGEKLLGEYLRVAPIRSTYPGPWDAHYWLGRLSEARKNIPAAKSEYQAALSAKPKDKRAQEALKRLGKR